MVKFGEQISMYFLSRKNSVPFIVALLGGFLFLFFRSADLASDGVFRAGLVATGDINESQFSGWQHFSQVPMARALFLFSERMGLGWTPTGALVFFGFVGNLLSVFFVVRAAGFRQASSWAACLSGFILCMSPVVFFYWNGETLNLPLGLSFCALNLAMQGSSLIWVALLLSLAALSRIDFALLAPGLVWIHGRYDLDLQKVILFIRKTFFFTLIVTAISGIILYSSLFAMGVVSLDPHSVLLYIKKSHGPYDSSEVGYSLINLFKACKGLASTLSPSINSLVELLRGTRGYQSQTLLWNYALYAIYVIALSVMGLVFLLKSAAGNRELRSKIAGAILLILPVQILLNWRFFYQSEEYHGASLVGLFCLVILFLNEIQKIKNGKFITNVVAAVFCFGFLFLYALPAREFPLDQMAAGDFLSAESESSRSKITLLVCDTEIPAVSTGSGNLRQIPLFRMADDWFHADPGSVTTQLANIISHELMEQNRRVLITGNRCNLKYLTRSYGKKPNAAAIIESISFNDFIPGYSLQELPGPRVPMNWYNQYDPVSWRYETLYEFKKTKNGSLAI